MTPRYKIRTVADFLAVPPDRREVCASEFVLWLAIAEDLKTLVSPAVWDGVFEWIDDGKRDISVTLTVTKEGTCTVEHGSGTKENSPETSEP